MIRPIIARLIVVSVFMFAFSAAAEDVVFPPAPPVPAAVLGKAFVYAPKPGDITIGKENAPLTVVEYASLSCPHCAHFFTATLPPIQKKYIDTGKVKLVYRDFPLNDPAVKAAMLVQCAPAERRDTFLKVLFSTQSKWAYDAGYQDSLGNIAVIGGIERPSFDACMKNDAIKKTVLATAKEAETDYKVMSTPTFFIGGKRQDGDGGVDVLSKAIDEALAVAPKK